MTPVPSSRRSARRLAAVLSAVLGLTGQVPARAQGAGKEFPGRVNLSVSRPSPVPYRGWPLPPGQAAAAKPLAVAGKVDGERLVFLDVDGNGKFDDAGIDGWTLEGCRAMVPVQPRIFVGMRSISLRFPETGFELRYDASAIGGTDKALEGLKTLNLLRLRNGIPPVDMDSGLSAACLKHARYCQKNGFAFKEDPAKPEASKEGASAAANSIAGWMDPAAFARACYAQFFAREMLFHPLVEVVGSARPGISRSSTRDPATSLVPGTGPSWCRLRAPWTSRGRSASPRTPRSTRKARSPASRSPSSSRRRR